MGNVAIGSGSAGEIPVLQLDIYAVSGRNAPEFGVFRVLHGVISQPCSSRRVYKSSRRFRSALLKNSQLLFADKSDRLTRIDDNRGGCKVARNVRIGVQSEGGACGAVHYSGVFCGHERGVPSSWGQIPAVVLTCGFIAGQAISAWTIDQSGAVYIGFLETRCTTGKSGAGQDQHKKHRRGTHETASHHERWINPIMAQRS